MKYLYLSLLMSFVLYASSCQQTSKQPTSDALEEIKDISIKKENTVANRFNPPERYLRQPHDKNSFAYYLKHFPLYPDGRDVYYFNGKLKSNQRHHAAVLNIDVGTKDLQQCADAIMRLRAEYLYSQKAYDKISFHFLSGFNATYADWREGKRIKVDENNVSWYQTNKSSHDRASFNAYLQSVFMYASTLSLEKELEPKALNEIEIGDVFIQGGSPGHAVIVMDMAVNKETNESVFLLAQSYMPAQDIHVINNPMNFELSPWYSISDIDNEVITPEWTFNRTDLRSF